MTWSEFTHALRHVTATGTTQGLSEHVRESMTGLGMIAGTEAGCEGVTLTETGRRWYQRAVVDRENARILERVAHALDSAFGLDGR